MTSSGSYEVPTAGQIFWQAVTVTTASTLVGFGVEVTTNTNSTGRRFAIALYTSNTSTGTPANLVASTSTIAATEGLNQIPIAAQALGTGNYFLAVAAQDQITISGSITSRTTFYCSSCFTGTLPSSAPAGLASTSLQLLHLYAVNVVP